MIDDARLIAYVAGELNARARAEVEAALAIDPLLASRLARHRDQQSRGVQTAALEAMPKRRRAGGRIEDSPANIVRLADRRKAPRVKIAQPFKWPSWSPIVLILGAGVIGGYVLAQTSAGPLAARPDGALAAHGALAQALERDPADSAGKVRLSFRTADRYCRVFQVEDLAGVACKQGPNWIARMTIRAQGPALPPAVLTAVGQMMVGRSLSRPDEDAARARRWAS